MCILCVRIRMNKRLFEPSCVWIFLLSLSLSLFFFFFFFFSSRSVLFVCCCCFLGFFFFFGGGGGREGGMYVCMALMHGVKFADEQSSSSIRWRAMWTKGNSLSASAMHRERMTG